MICTLDDAAVLALRRGMHPDYPTLLEWALSREFLYGDWHEPSRTLTWVDPVLAEVRLRFDEERRPTKLLAGTHAVLELGFDDNARIVSLTAAGLGHYTLERDAGGRVALVKDAAGNSCALTYDAADRVTSLVMPGGLEHRFAYDDDRAGWIHAHDLPGSRATWTRDDAGALIEVVGHGALKTRFYQTDGLAEVNDGVARWQLENDAAAGVVRIDRSDHRTVELRTTETGAPGRITWADGGRIDLEMSEGRLVAAHTDDEALQLLREPGGKLTHEVSWAGAVRCEYDEAGRLAALASNRGEVTRFEYDGANRLAALREGDDLELVIEGRRDKKGRRIEELRYGSLVERRRYTAAGRIEAVSLSTPRAKLADQRYEYDAAGRLRREVDTSGRRKWTRDLSHDAHGRVSLEVESAVGQVTRSYQHDEAGRMVRFEGHTIERREDDAPTKWGDAAIDVDAVGHLLEIPSPRGRIRCTFGDDGTLQETRLDGETIRYRYDALGRRIAKECPDGTTTRYIWSRHQLIAEEVMDPGTLDKQRRRYIYRPHGHSPIAMRHRKRVLWMQHDARGAVVRVLRSDGVVGWRARYSAYGTAHVAIDRVDQPFRLAGHYEDEETGLHYAVGRYYAPWLGAYLTPAARAPVATGRYGYAEGRPYAMVMPAAGGALPLGSPGATLIERVARGVIAMLVDADGVAQARRTLITSRAALAAGLPSLVRPPPYGPGIEETLRQLLRHAALPDPLRLLLRDEHESASWKLAERLLTALGRDLAPNVDERIACAAAASRLLRDPRAEGGADG